MIKKLITTYLIKKYDLIPRENAKYYVEFNTEMISQAQHVLEKRKGELVKLKGLPEKTVNKLEQFVLDMGAMLELFSVGHYILNDKDIKEMSAEEYDDINAQYDEDTEEDTDD